MLYEFVGCTGYGQIKTVVCVKVRVEMSAEILKSLRDRAEHALGETWSVKG